MQTIWIVAVIALVGGAAVPAAWLARARARLRSEHASLLGKLVDIPAGQPSGTFCMSSIADLPEPVVRYFRYALREGQPFIRVARYKQKGRLFADVRIKRWLAFEAIQVITPRSPGFIWNARVDVAPWFHVRVCDSYLAGEGAGQVSLLSAHTVADRRGGPEMNSASLHRYLAEAVWYPTALLPEAGVQWLAIEKNRALATLTDSGITVSLEFHFNDAGEVTRISTPGRWRSVKGGFALTPWEGHFREYQERAGIRIPMEGEVGWFASGELHLVWKGRIGDISYEFAQ